MMLNCFVLNTFKMQKNKIISVIIFLVSFSAAELYAQQRDSLTIDYNYINSVPQNAKVYLNESLAGETPFRFVNRDMDTSKGLVITIKLEGYIDYSFNVTEADLPLNKIVNLVPVNKLTIRENKQVEVNDNNYFKSPRKVVPIVVSSVITAGSGVLSYYFKKLANDRYDEYLATGDQKKFDQTKKYDLYSGLFLAAFQIGFAALIYFLLID
jgi:PEGA domain